MVADGTPWWKQGEQNAQRGKEGAFENPKTIACIKNLIEKYLSRKGLDSCRQNLTLSAGSFTVLYYQDYALSLITFSIRPRSHLYKKSGL